MEIRRQGRHAGRRFYVLLFFFRGVSDAEGEREKGLRVQVRQAGELPGLPQPGQMSYAYYNPNPFRRSVGDCAVRALSKALGQSWEETYVGLCLEGFLRGDLPNADAIWGPYLVRSGFRRYFIPDDGLGAYTVSDFAADHPQGTYILSMPGRHVLCVEDGEWHDSWDSGRECPTYYWQKEG